MTELESKILEMLKNRYVSSGGNNGYSIASLRYDLNITLEELRETLNNLEKEDRIYYRIGSATDLIFWNNKSSS